MENIIKSKSFKQFIEGVGRGCKMAIAKIENNEIHVWCKANAQNNIIFKLVFDEHKCLHVINGYGLYNKDEFSKEYTKFMNTLHTADYNLTT